MNLSVLLLLFITLGGSEWVEFEPVDDWIKRFLAVLLTAALVPAIALFQTGILIERFQCEPVDESSKQASCRRMTVAHALVWLSASAAIIWVLRWQDVVRGTWGLGNWPLLDELVILAPAILAMVASWLIFYELKQPLSSSNEPPPANVTSLVNMFQSAEWFEKSWLHLRQWVRPRLEFVALRFQIYFMMLLIPLTGFLLLKELGQRMVQFPEPLSLPLLLAISVLFTSGFPLMMLLVWRNTSIHDPEIKRALSDLSKKHRIQELQFRRWNTGHQIANAAVAGLIPRLRIIFLTDVVLDRFPQTEIEAIVRHEAGHIRRQHMVWRTGFLVAPILVMALNQPWLSQMPVLPFQLTIGEQIYHLGVSPLWSLFLIGIAMLAWTTNCWLGKQVEHDADLYAIENRGDGSQHSDGERPGAIDINPANARSMRLALLRLAAYSGASWTQSTLLHPSIKRRIEFLDTIEAEPRLGQRFRSKLMENSCIISVLWLLLGIMGWTFG